MIFQKSLILTTAILLSSVGLTACDQSKENPSSTGVNALETIKKNDVIRVGVFADNPPFGYVDSQGKPQGFDVALAKKVAQDLLGDENKIQYVVTEAANRVEFLKSDKVDVVFASFSVTPERKEVVDFAEPYLKASLGITSTKSNPITDIQQLENRTLIVNKGSSSDSYFSKNYPKVKLLKFEQNTDAFSALKDGRGDAISQDSTYALAWATENPEFVVGIPQIGNEDFIAPAVKKGNTELLNWLNTEIKQLRTSGEIQNIYNQTLKPIYGDKVDSQIFLKVSDE